LRAHASASNALRLAACHVTDRARQRKRNRVK
jgi:hypothetical protein